jgi:hypothetical protein
MKPDRIQLEYQEVFQTFVGDCRTEFGAPMSALLKMGDARELPIEAIAVAVATAALRCAALAIYSAGLDPAEFDETLLDFVETFRASNAKREASIQ